MGEDPPWSPESFEAKYAADADPWSFASSPYELARYDAVVGALRAEPHRYRLAYEPACSVGVLTDRLRTRCDALIATDVSPTAVERARARCGGHDGVRIEVASVEDGPGTDEPLDLVVFSELGYYFSTDDLARLVEGLRRSMAPGADLVACHWTGTSPDHQIGGHVVHEVLAEVLGPSARQRRDEVHDGFLLGAWRTR
jgi:SAM-dependent methyltransferase